MIQLQVHQREADVRHAEMKAKRSRVNTVGDVVVL